MSSEDLFERKGTVGVHLKKILKDKGYTKVSFAIKSEISKSTLDKMLEGSLKNKNIFDKNLKKILKTLKMSEKALMSYSSDKYYIKTNDKKNPPHALVSYFDFAEETYNLVKACYDIGWRDSDISGVCLIACQKYIKHLITMSCEETEERKSILYSDETAPLLEFLKEKGDFEFEKETEEQIRKLEMGKGQEESIQAFFIFCCETLRKCREEAGEKIGSMVKKEEEEAKGETGEENQIQESK